LVDYIAMDIKGGRDAYSAIACAEVDMDAIEKSIKIIYDFNRGVGRGEFRTTILNRFHDAYSIMAMGKWLNEICEGKPKKFFLQGFKGGHDMIDESYLEEKDVGEEFLEGLKGCAEEYFEEVEIRV
jgi:pyruvate formate lyase activating enzyme